MGEPSLDPSIHTGRPQAAATSPKGLGAGCGAGFLEAFADERTAEHSRERTGWDTPVPPYLDQVGRRSPPLLKVLLPMLLLHFEGEAGTQDPLGTGGDRAVGAGPHLEAALPLSSPILAKGSPLPALLTAGRAKKEMPSRANPAASIRPSHVCGALSP